MGLLALSIAPGLAICLFIYQKDKVNKEPLGIMLMCFLLGMLSIFPAIVIQLAAGKRLDMVMQPGTAQIAVSTFLVIALSEELSKFLFVRFYAFKRKAFDEPFDGILYSVMVGMGFATLENIGYVFEHGVGTGIMRMFLSVPAHATFAILMGYHVGLAKFDPSKRSWYFILALFWPVLFHGVYDFFLFLGNTWLHFAGAITSFIVAIRLSRKAIRKQQELSAQYADGVNDIEGNDHSII